jgi:phage gp45-like
LKNQQAKNLANRISNLLARGAVTLVDAASKLQTLQVSLLSDEAKETVEHLEPYGYTSNPLPGAEVLFAFIEGDRSHGVAVVASDRRYRVQNLASGDVAVYDNRGNSIKLTATGIVITGNVTINGNITTTGTLQNNGKDISSTHKHSGVTTGGGQTGNPI